METLTEDPNARVRLTAAGALLAVEAGDSHAGAVLMEALADPTPRVREAAFDVFESLGDQGALVLEAVQKGEPTETEDQDQGVKPEAPAL
ncbi:HEAT repeat domain-containing protein [Planctomyces sp. SH-PL62]|uniref:HEAT repeat domain-containing protein n=1 Tax=Planctomyces sp. SH-PL62 TaxID=1636152 RepID=UPI00078BF3B1|nr:HEAT repeat domain-containing protein [Planctomyces sp. SH-PL62]AMV37907.1 HEAT repeat protein [Planctomyces sp. SH-PL62]